MYSFDTHVRFSEIDETGRLSIPAAIDLLQDCSTFQSESLGVGPAHAKAAGRAWMISAWEIEVVERPAFNAPVRVSTWATSFKCIKATRDFTICTAGGGGTPRPLVRATSNWFMFDANAGRPIRLPEDETAPYLPDIERDAPLGMPPIPRRISAGGAGTRTSPVTVTGAHLDTNHHVNNAQYVSMALGALEELGGGAPSDDGCPYWLDVHYSLAAKLGDTVYPRIHRTADAVTVSLDAGDGRPYALIRLRR